jgi:protein SCO1
MIRLGRVYRSLLIAIVVALFLCSSAKAGVEKRYPAFGLVMKVEGSHALEVSCKEIPGFMEAMVMTLNVPNSAELKAIRSGMLVDFTLVVGEESASAEGIKVHEFQSPDQRTLQVRMLEKIQGAFESKPSGGQILAAGEKVPEFSLIDQLGHEAKLSNWLGKVVAVSFVYTKCSYSEYCFRLTNNLGLVAKRLADHMGNDVVLVTITFDPDTDTPEVLSKYAQNWKTSRKGWYFLTGPPADVQRVCLMFGMNFWPEMGMLAHSMHTAVIDREGRLVTNLEGNEFSADQLGDLIETLIDKN